MDGTQATLLVPGSIAWPDVSPDGQFALYHTLRADQLTRIAVVRIADGSRVNFDAEGTRARFTPDGHSIAYFRLGLTLELSGRDIVSQPFPSEAGVPVKVLMQSLPDSFIETFHISPDGKHIVASYPEPSRSLVMADGVAGISAPIRSR